MKPEEFLLSELRGKKLQSFFFSPFERKDLVFKEKAENFKVIEISLFGELKDCGFLKNIEKFGEEFSLTPKQFCWFVLNKKNWATDKALRAIAKALGVSFRRFNWAGTKDKKAITSQLCSIFLGKKERDKLVERIKRIEIKDITLDCFFFAERKIKLGELLGNRFEVFLSQEHYEFLEKHLKEIKEETGKYLFPNYFGMQRFGIRRNNHLIGYFLLKGFFEEAAFLLLTSTDFEENEKAIKARNSLKEHLDFKKAFQEFPKHLYIERIILNHLKDHPRDFVNAFRKLPRPTLLTFVHSLQSFIFNKELSIRFKEQGFFIKKEKNEYFCSSFQGFPDLQKEGEEFLVGNVVGYKSELNSYEEEILDKIGIEKKEFLLKSFPELSSKGSKRVLLAPALNINFNQNFLGFSLALGSYATSFLGTFFNLKRE